jgi:hypothetical protein
VRGVESIRYFGAGSDTDTDNWIRGELETGRLETGVKRVSSASASAVRW